MKKHKQMLARLEQDIDGLKDCVDKCGTDPGEAYWRGRLAEAEYLLVILTSYA